MTMTAESPAKAAKAPIYLDYQATTPTDPRVVEAMMPWFTERFGNPHSRDHTLGWESEAAVDAARGEVAALIGASAREIVFTSGATESNNIAIKGVARALRDERDEVVTCVTEHKCVLESCSRLEREGFRVTRLPVGAGGLIELAALEAALSERTALVSIMAVNNEIGVIQPLAEIGRLCRAHGARFHTDAAQAAGKIPLDVKAMGIDLLSISGHKLYGPKGVGALYVRRRPKVPVEPLFDGGGQERGLRAGTVPTPLVVGLGAACRIAAEEMTAERERLAGLKDRLLAGLEASLPAFHVHGDLARRIPGNLNLSFADVDAQDLMMRLHRLCVSAGSACTSATVQPSHVLQSLGLPPSLLHNAIRIGLGRFTTEAEIDLAVAEIAAAVNSLRRQAQSYEAGAANSGR